MTTTKTKTKQNNNNNKRHESNQPNMNSTIKVAAKLQKNETNQMRIVTQKRKAFNT